MLYITSCVEHEEQFVVANLHEDRSLISSHPPTENMGQCTVVVKPEFYFHHERNLLQSTNIFNKKKTKQSQFVE